MTRNRVLFAVAILLSTGSAWGGDVADLKPRRMPPKTPTALLEAPAETTGRLIIKLADETKAHARLGGRVTAQTNLLSVDPINEILERFGLTVRPAFTQAPEVLAKLEERASALSGFEQPFLDSMMYVEGAPDDLANMEAAAKALNDLTLTQWVTFEPIWKIGDGARINDPGIAGSAPTPSTDRASGGGGSAPGGTSGACCLTDGSCVPLVVESDCISLLGGIYQGDGTVCNASFFCGVCCLDDTCQEDFSTDNCVNQGGVYGGDHPGAECATGNPCGLFTGGCCLPDFSCSVVDQVACDQSGGSYWGNGSTCATSLNCTIGACCQPPGQCTIGDDADCEALENAFFQGNGVSCLPPQGQPGPCTAGSCCIGDDVCEDTENENWYRNSCIRDAMGVWVAGPNCEEADCDNDCGADIAGSCALLVGNGSPFCDDLECCELICATDPHCCDEDGGEWDSLCAAEAHLFCDVGNGIDRCLSQINGNCFEFHGTAGCADSSCCRSICDSIDPFCCIFVWDEICVDLALQLCTDTQPGFECTPDYERFQGYLTGAGYGLQELIELSDAGFIRTGIPGYGGQGWDFIKAGEPFTDDNGNGWWDPGEAFEDVGRDGIPGTNDPGEGNDRWDPPAGLRGIAEQLLHGDPVIDGTGNGNLTLGETTKVAVIESAYYEDHENLDVTTERGQTLLILEPERSTTFPSHGTACLNIIGGQTTSCGGNRFGVTGIVPNAELFFFPLTSREEGPRQLAAWASAMAELGAGDVISCSYELSRPWYNLNNNQATWELIRMASDLGITCCISAGNACFNLDGAPDQGDSGGMVVGACSPGFPWYRMISTNYCTDPGPLIVPDLSIARSNIVHVNAWGDSVTTGGFGNYPLPNGDRDRSYTGVFSGTDAATPQIAGLVAALQGLAKQFYGIPLMPVQIRAAMGAPGVVPENPTRELLNGGFSSDGCGLDSDPDQGPNMIGPIYPRQDPELVAGVILDNLGLIGFADAPHLDDVVVVRGANVRGNRWSVKGRDNSYLQLDAVYTRRNERATGGTGVGGGIGGGIDVPEIRDITYLATGFITDLVGVGHADITTVNTLIFETEVVWPNVFTLMFVEAYDWRRRKWTFVDVISDPVTQSIRIDDNLDYVFAHITSAAGRFVRGTDQRILVRIWTLGFPATGLGSFGGVTGDTAYQQKIDLINIFVSDQFGDQLP